MKPLHASSVVAAAAADLTRSVVGDAEARIMALLERPSQGRAAGAPATVQYLGVYLSGDGWQGTWTALAYAVRNLKAAGRLCSFGGCGTAEHVSIVVTPETPTLARLGLERCRAAYEWNNAVDLGATGDSLAGFSSEVERTAAAYEAALAEYNLGRFAATEATS